MDTQSLAKDIRRYCGSGMVTETQVKEYLGAGKNYPTKLLKGLQFLPKGNAKLYMAEDVARRINERKQQ